MRSMRTLIFIAMFGSITGCGGMGQVDGKLVWEDGSPARELEGSDVIFESAAKQLNARGGGEANGGFQLRPEKPGDGAPIGDYQIAIIKTQKNANPEEPLLLPPLLDPKYRDPNNSGLTAKVVSGVTPV